MWLFCVLSVLSLSVSSSETQHEYLDWCLSWDRLSEQPCPRNPPFPATLWRCVFFTDRWSLTGGVRFWGSSDGGSTSETKRSAGKLPSPFALCDSPLQSHKQRPCLFNLASWCLHFLFIWALENWTVGLRGNKLNTPCASYLLKVWVLKLHRHARMRMFLLCSRLWKLLLINSSNSAVHSTCSFLRMTDCCPRSLKKLLTGVIQHTKEVEHVSNLVFLHSLAHLYGTATLFSLKYRSKKKLLFSVS